jgi:hypothetical protein
MSHCVALSPLGGVGFRPVEVANPKGGSPRCSMWRCSVRCGQFNHWIPKTLTAIRWRMRRELILQWSQGFYVTPCSKIGCFYRPGFTVGTPC